MINKKISPLCGHVRVTFELPSCIWADRIFVSGEFNQWDETQLRMRQGRDGVWRAEVDLPANRQFEFRYVIDGKWQTDYHADGSRSNQYGSENSVVDTSLFSAKRLPEEDAEHRPELAQGALLCEARQAGAHPVRVISTRKGMQAAA